MPPRYDPALLATFLVGLDLAGTFILALSGAMAAIKHGLDLFGVSSPSLAAGNAGGLTRDVLLRAMPPPAISDRARPERGSARPEDASERCPLTAPLPATKSPRPTP